MVQAMCDSLFIQTMMIVLFILVDIILCFVFFFFFSSRRRHTRLQGDWSSDVCSSDLRTIFVYSLESGKESQITDGISDARYPVFDKGGKSLFFAVSTDVGLSAGWLDLSSFQHPVLRSVYVAVLKKGDPSPVEPQSDERSEEHTSVLQSPCN